MVVAKPSFCKWIVKESFCNVFENQILQDLRTFATLKTQISPKLTNVCQKFANFNQNVSDVGQKWPGVGRFFKCCPKFDNVLRFHDEMNDDDERYIIVECSYMFMFSQ